MSLVVCKRRKLQHGVWYGTPVAIYAARRVSKHHLGFCKYLAGSIRPIAHFVETQAMMTATVFPPNLAV